MTNERITITHLDGKPIRYLFTLTEMWMMYWLGVGTMLAGFLVGYLIWHLL